MALTGKLSMVALGVLVGIACGGRTLDSSAPTGDDDHGGSHMDLPGGGAGRSVAGSDGAAPNPPHAGAGGKAGSSTGGVTSGGSGAAGVAGASKGTFDPAEVYLQGTLSEGSCGQEALAHWKTPNTASVGFECHDEPIGIDPLTRRFIFQALDSEENTLYAFHPDSVGTKQPHANDEPLNSACLNPRNAFLDPAGGPVLYQCYGFSPCVDVPCHYYDATGSEFSVPSGYYLEHRGFDGALLLRQAAVPDDAWSVLAPDGQIHSVPELVGPGAIRAHRRGFWILMDMQRWDLTFDGVMTLEGKYPDGPPTTRFGGDCKLEASGAAICFGSNPEDSVDDQIVRAQLGSPQAEIVYSETSDPLVKIHISNLVTGP